MSAPTASFEAGAEAAARPRRRDGLLCHAVAGELVVWDGQNDTAVSLNLAAAAVWDFCDGTMSMEEITRGLAEIVGVEPDVLRGDVQQALQELTELDLVVRADCEGGGGTE